MQIGFPHTHTREKACQQLGRHHQLQNDRTKLHDCFSSLTGRASGGITVWKMFPTLQMLLGLLPCLRVCGCHALKYLEKVVYVCTSISIWHHLQYGQIPFCPAMSYQSGRWRLTRIHFDSGLCTVQMTDYSCASISNPLVTLSMFPAWSSLLLLNHSYS